MVSGLHLKKYSEVPVEIYPTSKLSTPVGVYPVRQVDGDLLAKLDDFIELPVVPNHGGKTGTFYLRDPLDIIYFVNIGNLKR